VSLYRQTGHIIQPEL